VTLWAKRGYAAIAMDLAGSRPDPAGTKKNAAMLRWENSGFSVDASVRITLIHRDVLPRHKAANWVGPGRGRKSTRPGTNGVVELSACDFLDRLADLVPPPRKHRYRPPI
jgi:hypothetical protein